MQTFQEIYEREVVLLSPADRLRLASLILRDVTQFPAPPVDTSLVDDATEWSDDDLREWSLHSHRQFGDAEAADAADK